MNRHVPRFLQRLALDLDADSKTIRRAYARELKLIDQEQDLSGFQLLREAYEAALEWAKHCQPQREPEQRNTHPALAAPTVPAIPVAKAEPAHAPLPGAPPETPLPIKFVRIPVPVTEAAIPEPETTEVIREPIEPDLAPQPVPVAEEPPAPPPPPPEKAPVMPALVAEEPPAPPPPKIPPVISAPAVFVAAENPHALAETVFARLVANTARIVELGMLKDAALLETELRNRLADEELFNITARKLFEARIADLLFREYTLAGGVLFGAAANVFGWDKDSRRLQPFGEAGVFLDRAIVERTMFQGQDPEELVKQRGVMARLRQTRKATIVQIGRDMAYVERMHNRFPNLMAIMVSRDTVEQWRSYYRATAAAHLTDATMPVPVLHAQSTGRRFGRTPVFFAMFALLLFVVFWNRDGSTPVLDPSTLEQSSDYPNYAPGADPSAPDYSPQPAESKATPGVQPTRAAKSDQQIVDAIVKDVQYSPAADAPYGVRTVVYDVLTADNGHIYGMNRLQRSIDPAYDEAVKAAIMRAKTLPANVRGPVRMLFSIEWKKPERKKAARAASKKEAAPSEPSTIE